jgi:hypothetical protein
VQSHHSMSEYNRWVLDSNHAHVRQRFSLNGNKPRPLLSSQASAWLALDAASPEHVQSLQASPAPSTAVMSVWMSRNRGRLTFTLLPRRVRMLAVNVLENTAKNLIEEHELGNKLAAAHPKRGWGQMQLSLT